MGYELCNEEAVLLGSATHLKKNYKGQKKQRLYFINRLDELIKRIKTNPSHTHICRPIMGALIYELEYIKEVDYKGYSPDKMHGLFSKLGKGSDIYTQIKQILNLTVNNILDDDERLICLNKFYWAVKKIFPEEIKFQQDIYLRLNQVAKREMQRINKFMNSLILAGDDFEHEVSLITNAYHQQVIKKNLAREKALRLLTFIATTSRQLYQVTTEPSAQLLGFFKTQTKNVRKGAFLYVLIGISKEKTFFSPKSILFKLCKEALKIQALEEVSPKKTIKWLRALSLHLEILRKSKNSIYAELYKETELNTLHALQENVESYISEEESKRIAPSSSHVVALALVRYGLGLTFARLTADSVLALVESAVVTGASGPLGIITYMAGGTILMTKLGQLVVNECVPSIIAYLYGFTLDKITEKIVENTAEVATHTFWATPDGFQKIFINATPKQQAFIQDWIDTLLELPDGIIPVRDKDQISQVKEMISVPEREDYIDELMVHPIPSHRPTLSFSGSSLL